MKASNCLISAVKLSAPTNPQQASIYHGAQYIQVTHVAALGATEKENAAACSWNTTEIDM